MINRNQFILSVFHVPCTILVKRICGVMIGVLVWNVVDRGYTP